MQNIKLLKDYQSYRAGDIIEVSNNIAHGLIENEIGRRVETRDVLVKPEIGVSKALAAPPSKAGITKRPK